MKGHRRDQSESHTPLRQSEQLQTSIDAQEVRITFKPNSEATVSNGSITQTSSFVDVPDTLPTTTQTTRPVERRNAKVSCYLCFQMCIEIILQRFRMELVKTAVAFYFLMIAAFLNFFLLTVIHDIVPKSNIPRLPDLVFSIIKQQKWAWVVGDVLSTFNSVVGFTIVLLHRHRLVVLRRVFLIGAIMYGLRAVILSVTFLPPRFVKFKITDKFLNF